MHDTTFVQLTDLLAVAQPDAHGVVRLPTERALAQSLHVQRSTVRERLASLEALGLIRRAQGSGTYLSLPNSAFVQLYFDTALKLGHFTTAQLEQAREMLEREIARVAATSATPDDIAMIEDALARMLAAGDVAQGDQADYEFHVWLARAAHNPVITLIISGLASVLYEVLQQRRRTIRAVPGGAERTNATHMPILAALRARDPQGAVAAMDAHFRVWEQESGRAQAGGTGIEGTEEQGNSNEA